MNRFFYPKNLEEIEGIVCIEDNGQKLIVLSTRGETELPMLIWCKLNRASGRLDIVGKRRFDLVSNDIPKRGFRRAADLYLDPRGDLWTVATSDPGDTGPFRSFIWRIGKIEDLMKSNETLLIENYHREIPGLKIEAISRSPFDPEKMSIGTDDENYGGVWRPLD